MQLKRGFTLVELMLGMALGLVVMLALLTFFTSNLRASQTSLELARLNQEMQTLSTLISRDIRRAGYRGDAVTNRDIGNKDFMFIPGIIDPGVGWQPEHLDNLDPDGSHLAGGPYRCIILMADLDGDADAEADPPVGPEDDEMVGYRFDATNNQVDKGRWSGVNPSCNNGTWTAFTSEDIEVTRLDFLLDPPVIAGGSRLKQSVTLTITANIRRKPEVAMTISQRVRLRNNVY